VRSAPLKAGSTQHMPEAAVTSPEISIKPGTQIKIVLDKF